jgi:hypothetical protein
MRIRDDEITFTYRGSFTNFGTILKHMRSFYFLCRNLIFQISNMKISEYIVISANSSEVHKY